MSERTVCDFKEDLYSLRASKSNNRGSWRNRELVGDAHFRLKFALKVTHPFRNMPTSTDFR